MSLDGLVAVFDGLPNPVVDLSGFFLDGVTRGLSDKKLYQMLKKRFTPEGLPTRKRKLKRFYDNIISVQSNHLKDIATILNSIGHDDFAQGSFERIAQLDIFFMSDYLQGSFTNMLSSELYPCPESEFSNMFDTNFNRMIRKHDLPESSLIEENIRVYGYTMFSTNNQIVSSNHFDLLPESMFIRTKRSGFAQKILSVLLSHMIDEKKPRYFYDLTGIRVVINKDSFRYFEDSLIEHYKPAKIVDGDEVYLPVLLEGKLTYLPESDVGSSNQPTIVNKNLTIIKKHKGDRDILFAPIKNYDDYANKTLNHYKFYDDRRPSNHFDKLYSLQLLQYSMDFGNVRDNFEIQVIDPVFLWLYNHGPFSHRSYEKERLYSLFSEATSANYFKSITYLYHAISYLVMPGFIAKQHLKKCKSI